MARKPTSFEVAVQNAQAAKARAQALRAQADNEEAEANEFLRLYEKFAPKEEVQAARAADGEFAINNGVHIAPDGDGGVMVRPNSLISDPPLSTTTAIQDAAREVLREAGTPLSIRQIYETILLRGIRIGGLQPMMNLSAKLSTSPDIQFYRDKGWWFRNAAIAHGGAP